MCQGSAMLGPFCPAPALMDWAARSGGRGGWQPARALTLLRALCVPCLLPQIHHMIPQQKEDILLFHADGELLRKDIFLLQL